MYNDEQLFCSSERSDYEVAFFEEKRGQIFRKNKKEEKFTHGI